MDEVERIWTNTQYYSMEMYCSPCYSYANFNRYCAESDYCKNIHVEVRKLVPGQNPLHVWRGCMHNENAKEDD